MVLSRHRFLVPWGLLALSAPGAWLYVGGRGAPQPCPRGSHLRRQHSVRAALCQRRAACCCKFGVIGDVQYADVEDGTDFQGRQQRFFRNSLQVLRSAVRRWQEEEVDFAVQMGDLIDGRNAAAGQSAAALARALQEFPKELPRVDLLGNHELYNFPRSELASTGLQLRGEGLKGAVAAEPAGGACYFHAPADGDDGMWELIVLDAYEIANIGYPEEEAKFIEAILLLGTRNPRALQQGVDWFEGLPEEQHRYVPLNGAVGQGQLEWLQQRLAECQASGRRAIVLSHIPLLEASTTPKTVLWNAEEVLALLNSEHGRCVAGVLAGHDHESGFAIDPVSGIPHVTFLSPLICPPDCGATGAATMECYDDGRAYVKGHGVFCVLGGASPQRALAPFSEVPLVRVDPRGW